MFNNLFGKKKQPKTIVNILCELSNEIAKSLRVFFLTYLKSTNSDHNSHDYSEAGVIFLSMFLTSSQFLMNSKLENKKEILDEFVISNMKHELSEQGDIDDTDLDKAFQSYQNFYFILGKKFGAFLSAMDEEDIKALIQGNEFIDYCASEIFDINETIFKYGLVRIISINISQLKSKLNN